MLTNERAINQSIKNLVQTIPGEAAFNYRVGTHVRSYLFEIIDLGTAGLIRNEIDATIKRNEPRAKVKHIEVDPKPEQQAFLVTVRYEVVGYDQVFTVEYLLEPTRS